MYTVVRVEGESLVKYHECKTYSEAIRYMEYVEEEGLLDASEFILLDDRGKSVPFVLWKS